MVLRNVSEMGECSLSLFVLLGAEPSGTVGERLPDFFDGACWPREALGAIGLRRHHRRLSTEARQERLSSPRKCSEIFSDGEPVVSGLLFYAVDKLREGFGAQVSFGACWHRSAF